MKLDLDINLTNLKGEPMRDKLSDILANILAMSTVGKPAQMITWAVNLTNTGTIDVKDSDVELLKKVVESDPRTVNLAKAQLLEELEKLVD